MGYDGGITEERHVCTGPGFAEAEINPYRILQFGTGANAVIQATSGTQYPYGISGNGSENGKAIYAADDAVAVKIYGVAYLKMSGTGSKGNRIMATTGGKGLKHSNTDGVYIIGNATCDWTDGQIIPIIIDRYFIGDWTLS